MKNFQNYDVYAKTPDSYYRDSCLELNLKHLIEKGQLDDDVIELARTYIEEIEAIDAMNDVDAELYSELLKVGATHKTAFRHFARYNVQFREHFLTQFIQAYKESF